ncbi:MAG: Hsp20/alpha crystallin family protein [Saprospiraceae bacterium]|jgi:HSP20 family protein|nr:Hsp20/alpha crystallin family protein [Saprospiraceae bacterium]MBK7469115.1 Hsp20/alpha crystallin family protein [Saprospiraceae bacterium]MBK9992666.1 Hsp20/alpha crystallin family protein [Saprospiraceae bacterium]
MWKSNYHSNYGSDCATACATNTMNSPRTQTKTKMIPINVKESETEFQVEFRVFGFAKEEVSIDTKENILTVSAKKQNTESDTATQFLHKEFRVKDAVRKISIPSTVNAEDIKAKYHEGILLVTLPKSKKENKTIEIK